MGWYKAGHKETDTKNNTASFTHNRNRENIKSGETHSTIFGKIARYFADLKMVAFTGDYDDLNGKPSSFPPSSHKHGKADITDFPASLPASDVPAWAKAANKPVYNWSEISNKPSAYPPASHTHSYLPLSGGAVSGSLVIGSRHSVSGSAHLVTGRDNVCTTYQNFMCGSENTIKNESYENMIGGGGNVCDNSSKVTMVGEQGTVNKGSQFSFVAGKRNTVAENGKRAAVFGNGNTARNDQFITGHYADSPLCSLPNGGDSDLESYGREGTAFAIGNGYASAHSNAFRVNYDGTVYSKAAYNTTGADYAEYFEWADGNVAGEDRTGMFVTLGGGKIKPAEEGEYILGVISANPSITGNSDEHWMGKFKMDKFNRYCIQEYINEDGSTATGYVLNEEYDPGARYIHRADRPEWDAVGLLGQLVCRDDGTCQADGYCKCSQNGMATAAAYEEGSFQTPVYKVMERVADGLIKVLVK